jgi:hypothetical protein
MLFSFPMLKYFRLPKASFLVVLPTRLHRTCLSDSPTLIQSSPALENKSLIQAAHVLPAPVPSSGHLTFFLLQYTISSWLEFGS